MIHSLTCLYKNDVPKGIGFTLTPESIQAETEEFDVLVTKMLSTGKDLADSIAGSGFFSRKISLHKIKRNLRIAITNMRSSPEQSTKEFLVNVMHIMHGIIVLQRCNVIPDDDFNGFVIMRDF